MTIEVKVDSGETYELKRDDPGMVLSVRGEEIKLSHKDAFMLKTRLNLFCHGDLWVSESERLSRYGELIERESR